MSDEELREIRAGARAFLHAQLAGYLEQHYRDSAMLRRICESRDEQRDGRLAALERAAATESRVAELRTMLAAPPPPAQEPAGGVVLDDALRLLRELREATYSRPSCQLSVVDRCQCFACVSDRVYDFLDAQQQEVGHD